MRGIEGTFQNARLPLAISPRAVISAISLEGIGEYSIRAGSGERLQGGDNGLLVIGDRKAASSGDHDLASDPLCSALVQTGKHLVIGCVQSAPLPPVGLESRILAQAIAGVKQRGELKWISRRPRREVENPRALTLL